MRFLSLVACLAACTVCPSPTWSVSISGPGNADVAAVVGADGVISLAIADSSPIRFDDRPVGPTLARVSPTGQIVQEVAGVPGAQYVGELALDDAGGMVVLWGSAAPRFVAYTPALEVRWEQLIAPGEGRTPFDVSPTGDLVFAEPRLTMLNADGTRRWLSNPLLHFRPTVIRVADNGDVLAVGVVDELPPFRRVRFAADDGRVVEDILFPPALVLSRDGSGFAVDDPAVPRFLERIDAAGKPVWRIAYDLAIDGQTLASNGDLLALSDREEHEVRRYDGATGALRTRTNLCDRSAIAGGDPYGFLAVGRFDAPSRDLTRFDE